MRKNRKAKQLNRTTEEIASGKLSHKLSIEALEIRHLLNASGWDIALVDETLNSSETLKDVSNADDILMFNSNDHSPLDILDRVEELVRETGEQIDLLAMFSHGIEGVDVLNDENISVETFDDSYVTEEDTSVMLTDMFVNDVDIDISDLSTISVTQPEHGNVVDSGDGTFVYTPSQDYYGTDSFTYTVSDTSGGTSIATVTIDISPVEDAPVAVNDMILYEGSTVVLDGIISNDYDPDGDEIQLVTIDKPATGYISSDYLGRTVYIRPAYFNEADTISYTIVDSNGNMSIGTIVVMPIDSMIEEPADNNSNDSVDDDATSDAGDVYNNDVIMDPAGTEPGVDVDSFEAGEIDFIGTDPDSGLVEDFTSDILVPPLQPEGLVPPPPEDESLLPGDDMFVPLPFGIIPNDFNPMVMMPKEGEFIIMPGFPAFPNVIGSNAGPGRPMPVTFGEGAVLSDMPMDEPGRFPGHIDRHGIYDHNVTTGTQMAPDRHGPMGHGEPSEEVSEGEHVREKNHASDSKSRHSTGDDSTKPELVGAGNENVATINHKVNDNKNITYRSRIKSIANVNRDKDDIDHDYASLNAAYDLVLSLDGYGRVESLSDDSSDLELDLEYVLNAVLNSTNDTNLAANSLSDQDIEFAMPEEVDFTTIAGTVGSVTAGVAISQGGVTVASMSKSYTVINAIDPTPVINNLALSSGVTSLGSLGNADLLKMLKL